MVEAKYAKSQLSISVLFKYFKHEARFPENAEAVPFPVVEFIAKQLRTSTDQFYSGWKSRMIERYRAEIRKFFGFREHTADDLQDISQWLADKVLSHIHDIDVLKERVYAELRKGLLQNAQLL